MGTVRQISLGRGGQTGVRRLLCHPGLHILGGPILLFAHGDSGVPTPGAACLISILGGLPGISGRGCNLRLDNRVAYNPDLFQVDIIYLLRYKHTYYISFSPKSATSLSYGRGDCRPPAVQTEGAQDTPFAHSIKYQENMSSQKGCRKLRGGA